MQSPCSGHPCDRTDTRGSRRLPARDRAGAFDALTVPNGGPVGGDRCNLLVRVALVIAPTRGCRRLPARDRAVARNRGLHSSARPSRRVTNTDIGAGTLARCNHSVLVALVIAQTRGRRRRRIAQVAAILHQKLPFPPPTAQELGAMQSQCSGRPTASGGRLPSDVWPYARIARCRLPLAQCGYEKPAKTNQGGTW